ncbi:MAG TPA: diacylglycerol kinase family protein [Alphaproteobacteria bacterium]|nr:diacylglycerol kinase family protein [Alphaproteobacteria bacterium]
MLVIYNPVAGPRQRRQFGATLRHLTMAGCTVAVRETAAAGAAGTLARAALDENHDVIVAAGGDGTINEIINAVAGTSAVLGLIPLGTANVLAAEIGLPDDPRGIAEVIAHGRPRPIYLGAVGTRRFAMMASFGYDAQAVDRVDLALKRRLGKLAYVASALATWLRPRDVRFTLEIDGRPDSAASVVVAKGHYYGGRFQCAPEARLDDPRLYVCLLERPGRWNLLRYGLALGTGQLSRLRDVRIVPAEIVRVTAPAGEPIQADGDIVGETPAEFRVSSERLNLLMPDA